MPANQKAANLTGAQLRHLLRVTYATSRSPERDRYEMVHLLEASHDDRFVAILSAHWPQWREARQELNELPLASEEWGR